MRVTARMAWVVSIVTVMTGSALAAETTSGKMPVTTKSEEARALYLKGRDLAEKLRATDAHKLFVDAVAKDKEFATAQLAIANSAASAQEFFDAEARAVALAGKVSETERLVILAQEAGTKGQVAKQKELLDKLVALVPNDERAHNLLGAYLFGQQDWAGSVAEYQKAVALNPNFSQPYNQMGYAYRFMEKFNDSEAAFKKYIELIPDDPNPYDSYAELQMKMGRFDEAIKTYQKALSIDPNFVSSYVGIGNCNMFLNRGDDARTAFAKLASVARNDGEKRQALFWSAESYLHENKPDQALAEIKKEAAIAEASKDLANLGADHNFMGQILLFAGKPAEAATEFKTQLDLIDKAEVPADVKAANHRNRNFDLARVAIAQKDLATAKKLAATYAKEVGQKKIPFEVRQSHELDGLVALEEKKYDAAVAAFEQANQQDPRVLYHMALALQGKGDTKRARATAVKAADFNALGGNYGFYRLKAKELVGKLAS
jgi:tetratricopeptide (TPR) repeat protein